MSDGKAQIMGRFEIPEGDALIKAQELKARKGRLTVTEAIQMLIDKAEFLNLSTPVKAGKLFSYAPGSNKRLVGNTDNCSDDEELFPAELNAWLDANYPHIDFRFPEVGTVKAGATDDVLPASDDQAPLKIEAKKMPPATQAEIKAAFDMIAWGDKLQKAPNGKDYQWLAGTWVRKGSQKPGDASTYNPAAVAVALVADKRMTYPACELVIRKSFPNWFDEWEARAELLKN